MGSRQGEVLRAACCVAGLDGEVTDDELRVLRRMKDSAGVGEASFNAMLERARTDETYHHDVLRVARDDAEEVVRSLVEIAKADGEVTGDERKVIVRFAERMGLDGGAAESVIDGG